MAQYAITPQEGDVFSLPNAAGVPPSRKFKLLTIDVITFKGKAEILNGRMAGLTNIIQFHDEMNVYIYPPVVD